VIEENLGPDAEKALGVKLTETFDPEFILNILTRRLQNRPQSAGPSHGAPFVPNPKETNECIEYTLEHVRKLWRGDTHDAN
jgi:hypothetical protein